MIWLVPIAWIGAAGIASPIVIHLLARPRPTVQPFPTLRFVADVPSVAVRRRRLEEIALLLVRCAIVVLAAAALAGPLAITAGRRAAWNARIVRETVEAADGPIRVGLARAVARLDIAPPGRREIVIRSTFPIGSIDAADIAAVPSTVGLRLLRTGTPLASREVDASTVLDRSADATRPIRTPTSASNTGQQPIERSALAERRRITLAGPRTSVSDVGSVPAAVPLDIVSRADANTLLDAVVGERVLAPVDGRRARLLIADAPAFSTEAADARPIRAAWMADAIARMTRDEDVDAVFGRLDAALTDPTFAREPWVPVVRNQRGSPAAAAAADARGRLTVATATRSESFETALLIRSLLNALAPTTSPAADDVVAIDDAQLRAWSREPGAAVDPRRETVDDDDRRVLWIAVLALLGVETWMRRAR